MGVFYGNRFDILSLSPALWLSDTGSDPAQWDDISGNGRHATQSDSARRPSIVTNTLNGRQVRRFDGGNDVMLMDLGTSFSQPVTLFAVTKKVGNTSPNSRVFHASSSPSSGSSVYLPLASNNLGNFVWNFGTDSPSSTAFGNDWSIYNVVADSASSSIRRDGSQVLTGNPGTNGLQRYASVGGRHHDGLRNYNGDIAEILVFPTALSTSQRQAVEKYLANKYAIPLAS
jgi:hypothetical protein